LATGNSVLQYDEGGIYEVFPDGTRRLVKTMPPRMLVTPGQKNNYQIMNTQIPRLRIFAGPNGSGKTTIKTIIRPELLGVYINPDEIEKNICQSRLLIRQF
jgi:replication-associated recombination protein RarA